MRDVRKRRQWAEWRMPRSARWEQVCGQRGSNRSGARTTKCRPRCAFPGAVSPGYVARAFARCGNCIPESVLSPRCASRLRSIPPPQVRASLTAATQGRRGALNQLLWGRRLGGRSGWTWGLLFNSPPGGSRPYALERTTSGFVRNESDRECALFLDALMSPETAKKREEESVLIGTEGICGFTCSDYLTQFQFGAHGGEVDLRRR